jgi:hypothetical protein
VRNLVAIVVVSLTVLGGTAVPAEQRAGKDLALTREMTHGTEPLLRVIVRTRPERRAFDRVATKLRSLMAAASVAGAPQVHDQLFAVTAQISREKIAVLEADADVVQISTDALVRSLASNQTDVAWSSLVAQRNALRTELDKSVTAVSDSYAPGSTT